MIVNIPAKAETQKRLESWIPARAGYRQLGRNDELAAFET